MARFALLAAAGFFLWCTGVLLFVRSFPPPVTAVQAQRRVEAFFGGDSYQSRSQWTPLAGIPVNLQRAVIAAEDGAFHQHSGIDWAELRLALQSWRSGGRLRGASTISQQLVKNLLLTTSRSPVRKALEYPLTPLAEAILTKDRILELYLNVIEWGPGVWGAAAAAEYHYGKPLASLTREEAARLAACIPAPRTRKPHQMNTYAAVILERMRLRGW